MSRRRRAFVKACAGPQTVALVLAALLAPAACTETPERVRVGVAINSRTHAAVQLAIDEINAAGGIDGVPLQAAGLDWAPERANAVAIIDWANRFADEPEILGVIGHSNSTATLTSAAIYNRRQVPQLVTIATNPAITDIGPWTYRLCISDARQGPALARYAMQQEGYRRPALVYVNDEYGKGLAQEFRAAVESLGGTIVSSTFHADALREEEDRQHVERALRRLRALPPEQAPDVFVLVQRADAGLWTIDKIRELGFDTPVLGADNFSLTAFLARYPPTAEGLRASSFYTGPADTPRGQAFEQAFRERTGRPADYGDAYAYDAVYLLRDAVAGGGFSRTGVKRYLDRLIEQGREIDGVGGSFSLGPDHDARRSFFIVELEGGVATRVQTLAPE